MPQTFKTNSVIIFSAIQNKKDDLTNTISYYSEARLTILLTTCWSVIEKYHAIRDLTLDSIKDFAIKLKESFRLDCLVQGNYSKEQALDVARNLKRKLRPKTGTKVDSPAFRICQVPQGERHCRLASFHPSDSNSVVTNYYQCGPTNIRQSSTMEILTVRLNGAAQKYAEKHY